MRVQAGHQILGSFSYSNFSQSMFYFMFVHIEVILDCVFFILAYPQDYEQSIQQQNS